MIPVIMQNGLVRLGGVELRQWFESRRLEPLNGRRWRRPNQCGLLVAMAVENSGWRFDEIAAVLSRMVGYDEALMVQLAGEEPSRLWELEAGWNGAEVASGREGELVRIGRAAWRAAAAVTTSGR